MPLAYYSSYFETALAIFAPYKPPMKKAYYLSTCSTCNRILDQIKDLESFQTQDIKTNPLTTAQVEEMRALTDSYEALFSKRAMKYRGLGLHEQNLTEEDFKRFILEEYTFLKRPVFIVGNEIFIGNAKKTITQLLEKIQ